MTTTRGEPGMLAAPVCWRSRLAQGLLLALAGLAPASAATQDSKPEEFEPVDPYTRGAKEQLARLRYVSFGPFPWAEGHDTGAIEETLGRIPLLWVETPHFKLGSSLPTYKLQGDRREAEKLEGEIARLKERVSRFKPPKGELDPWLRLHLYAQRLEELYEAFCASFGIADADFAARPPGDPAADAPYMGEGPYLGQKAKLTVLLVEKSSSFGRYAQKYLGVEEEGSYRYSFTGGGMFFGMSEQSLEDSGYQLDAALHCAVVSGVTLNLVDSFRNNRHSAPLWLKFGLAHVYSRRADPRWSPYGVGSSGTTDENNWIWEPRVRGLVANKGFPSWEAMLGWKAFEELDVHGHLLAWSRVEFLLARKDSDRKAFLMGVTDPPPAGDPADPGAAGRALVDRQVQALQRGFGLAPAELEAEWVRHVLKTYSRK